MKRTVEGRVHYTGPMAERPRYYANDHSRDVLVVRYSPRHRWSYFSNMTREEVLVFKTNDSDPRQPHHVPHTAFNDPTCPVGVAPRASIEMRAIAYWFGA